MESILSVHRKTMSSNILDHEGHGRLVVVHQFNPLHQGILVVTQTLINFYFPMAQGVLLF